MKRAMIMLAATLAMGGCGGDKDSSTTAADPLAGLLPPTVTSLAEAAPVAGGALPAGMEPPAG